MMMKSNKTNRVILVIIAIIILFAFSLQSSYGANITINETSQGGINSAIKNNTVNPGDTIFLDPGTYNKTNNDTNVLISKNITIKGNGGPNQVIIDGRNQSRIFTIDSGVNVTFINIKFINGNSGDGGAVYSEYANTFITFINCTFTDNYATQRGGAIFNSRGNLSIINSTFINNNASVYGGAIYNEYAIINITDSNFKANNAFDTGGAIFNDRVNITITGSNFTNNNAFANGLGGIAGAIYLRGNMSVTDSNFDSNFATNYGGAIYVYRSNNVTITGSNFANNSAKYGGAIYNFDSANMSVWGSNFTNNNGSYGGAIYNEDGANMSVTSSNFTNNEATLNGGAIYNYNAVNMSVTSSNFTGNNARIGGAIYNYYGDKMSVTNSDFTNNQASQYGGGIFNYAAGIMSVSGNTMTGNSAGFSGQAIYNNGTMGGLNLTFIGNSTLKVGINTLVTLYAALTDDMGNFVAGGNITFLVNGNPIGNIPTDEGKANITYTPSSLGTMSVDGNYTKSGSYGTSNFLGQLRVVKDMTITAVIPNGTVGETVNVVVTLNESIDIVSDVIIGGVIFKDVVFENGVANVFYTITEPFSGLIEVVFVGNDVYNSNNTLVDVKFSKNDVEIVVNDETTDVAKKVTLTAKLLDKKGKPLEGKTLSFYVNGVHIGDGITNSAGIATVEYTADEAGKFTVEVRFLSDNSHNSGENTGILTVKEASNSNDMNNNNNNDNDKDIDNNDIKGNDNKDIDVKGNETENIDVKGNDTDDVDVNLDSNKANANMKSTGIPIVILLIIAMLTFALAKRNNS